jgi:hypothetical protein
MLRLEDSEEFEAAPSDLRLLLDGRLLESVRARQRDLAAVAATDVAARDELRQTQERVRQLQERMRRARDEAAAT